MSVRTTADDKIEEAKDLLKQAQTLLTEAIDPSTWGSEDFQDSYVDKLQEIVVEIIVLRRKI